ncbi:mitomycin antibiotics/polyketide fumonisin biosynthesis protein [Mycobacterium sp. PS03-16]|uniref:phytanoyl-CoA dioxygenase family protein n=1 Tax=Mycobacterium sp. PS03-16 TaxID=2559611 RepID=UPI001073AD97|nr:phytanoyl-CoA dioxygenase family protein [Mycobacterium sp. PS03-16]TFV54581.1 mitomycin antibiotics/polyketide fumonisin biosynthesis protein [Mycobacterium sp. PS03-16]
MVDVNAFRTDGFVKLEQPELRAAADDARAALWQQIGLAPDAPESWTRPVVWAADLTGAGPFATLIRSRRLAAALDTLCGPGGWRPRGALGNIPIRFPLPPETDDRGWHIDLSTPQPDGSWAVSGRPHTLLLLTLLSEVGPDDAPTRIRVGSHRDVAAALDENPVPFPDFGPLVEGASRDRAVAPATGHPGDMYLLHPLTVHAADEHRGATPRFMAQAPVELTRPLNPDGTTVLETAAFAS